MVKDYTLPHEGGLTVNATEDMADPAWLDRDLYPFESHYMDLEPGRLHYVDEGQGRPLVMLHGNPEWSFSYRHPIKGLSDRYRCLAPDYFGFGLSDKPVGWSYRPADHTRVVEAFIDSLELEDFTLVGNDWGGPIGLDYVTRNPENVHSIVLMNTFMWPVEELMGRLFSTLLGNRISRFFIRRYNLFVKMMKVGVADESSLPEEIHRHYSAPLATPDDREASWVFPREINGSYDWLNDLWERRREIGDTPMLLVWGLQDKLFRPALSRFQETFPHAETVEFTDVEHYVHEELGPEFVPSIEEFLAGAEA